MQRAVQDLDRVHAERVTLEQASHHLSRRHGLGLGAAIGDGLFRQRLDTSFHTRQLGRLAHRYILRVRSAAV